MRSGWLLRDGDVVCALEMAETPAERRILRERAGCDGALHVEGVHSLHTLGMKFPIDVAFLSVDSHRAAGRPPQAVAAGSGRLEAPGAPWPWARAPSSAGASRVGDQLELREARPGSNGPP